MATAFAADAIVLRSFRTGEADRVVHLLTPDHGRVNVIAKGARKTTAKMGARLEPMTRIEAMIRGPLRDLVDEKAGVIRGWAENGQIAPVDPRHLIFSIWAVTQHYADFDAQIRAVLGVDGDRHLVEAERFLTHLYSRALAP